MKVFSGMPEAFNLGLGSFKIFINDLAEEVEGMLIKFANGTKMGGRTDTLDGTFTNI